MKIDTFENFLREIVAPMFPGASVLKPDHVPKDAYAGTVFYDRAPTKLRVRQTPTGTEVYNLQRRQAWEEPEINLIKKLVDVFNVTKCTAAPLLNKLEDYIVRRAVAQTVSSGQQSDTLESILETLSGWSSQTYEGERVSSGIVIDAKAGADISNASILDLMQEDFGKILSDGVDSWWQVGPAGQIKAFETASAFQVTKEEGGYFPLRYQPLAAKAASGCVAITLNRNGEILVFINGELKFAKRRGRWLHLTHDPVITAMSGGGASSLELRKAIYESCLDASFARSGACIGLIRKNKFAEFSKSCPVSKDDLLSISPKLKPQIGRQLIDGRLFQKIPRLVRKELLGLDGATVISTDGTVLATGAILELQNVKRGNHGGRSAAAKALSRFGLGIKVSEDGMISGYKLETGEVEPAFNLG